MGTIKDRNGMDLTEAGDIRRSGKNTQKNDTKKIFCFCQVHAISVLYCAHLCMKCSLGVSNFLEEISNLPNCLVFLYFFALIAEEGCLISPCYSLELCILMGISFLFSFAFHFSSFLSYLKALLRQPFCLFAFLFLGDGFDHCLLYDIMNLPPQSFKHSMRSNPLNLFVTPTVKQ